MKFQSLKLGLMFSLLPLCRLLFTWNADHKLFGHDKLISYDDSPFFSLLVNEHVTLSEPLTISLIAHISTN